MKAQQAYRDANSGLPVKIPNDIFKPSNLGEETKDELSIFSGKTHTLTAMSTSSAVASAASAANPPSNASNESRSSSDSPQLVTPDNPSFKNVHPSLVSELNVFNGLIKRQLENAYRAGGEVFGADEPMIVDGQGSGGVHHHHHQPTQMHVVRQHQQQQHQHQQAEQVMYEPDYQRQQFDKQEAKRLERERAEAANREMEIQDKHSVERQELARQQQLQQQREIQRQQAHGQEIQRQEFLRQQQLQQAQQGIIQQQQQLDIRRQQEKQQQQMQGQYRQQLEVQQHQLQQRQPPQYHLQSHSYDHDHRPTVADPDYGIVTSSAHPAPSILTQSHSQSHPNIHHAYQQRPHHYQPIHHPDTGGLSSYAQLPPAQRVTQLAQQPIRYPTVAQQPQPQQHSMYAVPPEYSSSDSIQTGICYVPPPTSTYLPPTPISATSSPSSYVPHWSASSYSFAMPDQQATSASTVTGAGSVYAWDTIPSKRTPEYQQYTPEGALRGIAADDRSLQETWQTYMNKVRSPDLSAS